MPDPVTTKEIKLSISGQIPGEQLIIAILHYMEVHRETMDPEIRKEWDKRALQVYDDWRAFWVAVGLVPEVKPK